MYLKIKLDSNAIKPSKAHCADAGFDLYCREAVTLKAHESHCFDTGVHIDIPKGLVGFLKSKSGLNCKYSIQGEGVIDAGYTGSIVVKLYNNSNTDYLFNKGDKISQIVFLPIPDITLREVDDINIFEKSERLDNGFGSTGR